MPTGTTVPLMTDPTFARVPEGDETTGKEAVDLARAYGVPLDEWQVTIVRGILRESHGGWSASQAGLVVGRQNGKGQILLALELAGLLLFAEQVLHTAHAVKTSSDAFRRLWRVIEEHSDLSRLVKRHSQQVGLEYVELTSGARIAFTTRSASAGRGLSIDRLVVDEAEDLPAPEVGALAPTVFSRPKAQSVYFGTAPGPMHDAEAFATMRKAAHEGLNPRLAWWEWCAEYGADLDDQELWRRVNPAVASGRVALQAIVDDRAVLPPDQFRAERLSMWIPTGGASVFEASSWEALLDRDSTAVKDLAIGVDAPPSRDAATVCLAGRREDGKLHVEWYETRDGVRWLPEWTAERLSPKLRAVVVDARNPLAELDWPAAGVRPTLAGSRDVAAAAGVLYDGIADAGVRHRGQVELSRGVLGAKQRPMVGGQAFGWDRKAPGSSALLAASLAVWGVEAPNVSRPRRRRPGEPSSRRIIVM
jgi:phage terminase large subunit-like protein